MERIINITGRARNIEGHAVLVADNIGTYYIAGMNCWQEDWVNMKVKVIGDLTADKKQKKPVIHHPVLQLLKEEIS
jgi:hypothetical protein